MPGAEHTLLAPDRMDFRLRDSVPLRVDSGRVTPSGRDCWRRGGVPRMRSVMPGSDRKHAAARLPRLRTRSPMTPRRLLRESFTQMAWQFMAMHSGGTHAPTSCPNLGHRQCNGTDLGCGATRHFDVSPYARAGATSCEMTTWISLTGLSCLMVASCAPALRCLALTSAALCFLVAFNALT